MDIPEYWLRRPVFRLEPSHLDHFEAVYQVWVAPARGDWIDGLRVPKWVFLNWLCEEKGLLMHGSVNPNIEEFEPRVPNAKDDDAFSQQTAVFAASDWIWPMFYALLDRKRTPMQILNGCLRFELEGGRISEPRYFFSVTQSVLEREPFVRGTIYVLPKTVFVVQPPYTLGAWTVHDPHWASLEPVRPLAKLSFQPEEFPFLRQIRGHDNETVMARAKADPTGFPWLAEVEG